MSPTNCLALALGALLLCGCTQSELRLNDDFGRAIRQDTAAQVADPDAQYQGTITPGSNGARVGLAQKRYEHDSVIQPSRNGASSPQSIASPAQGQQTGGGSDSGSSDTSGSK